MEYSPDHDTYFAAVYRTEETTPTVKMRLLSLVQHYRNHDQDLVHHLPQIEL